MKIRCLFGHDYDGCICRRCGKAHHHLNGCTCTKCGATIHTNSCICSRCGAGSHEWGEPSPYLYYNDPDPAACGGTTSGTIRRCVRCGEVLDEPDT